MVFIEAGYQERRVSQMRRYLAAFWPAPSPPVLLRLAKMTAASSKAAAAPAFIAITGDAYKRRAAE
jgi:hypothetical protein